MSNSGDLFLYAKYGSTAREQGWSGLYEQRTVEYPPLAVAFIVAIDRASTLLPVSGNPLTNLKVYDAPPELRSYKFAHRCIMLGVFLFTVRLVRRLSACYYPEESRWQQFQRLLLFLCAAILSGYVLLDRLDLALAALVAAGLWLLIRGQATSSLVLLAAAIAFKLVPIVLVPIWILGTLPVEGFRPRHLRQSLGRLAMLAGFVVLFCLPVFLEAGVRSMEFLSYHRARGIEYESSYAACLLALKPFGHPVFIRAAFGSGDVESPLAPALLHLAPMLVALGQLLVWTLCLLAAQRGKATGQILGTNWTLAQVQPKVFVSATLLSLLSLMLFNKVFSPQYVVWVLPLLPLIPLKGKARVWFWAMSLALCGITALIYPLWWQDVLGPNLPGQNGCMEGPGFLGIALLVGRVLLLGVLIGMLLRFMLKWIRAQEMYEECRESSRSWIRSRRSPCLQSIMKTLRILS
jgi:hypothetical protein